MSNSNKEETHKWRMSGVSRIIGIFMWTIYLLYTIYYAEDIWSNALIQVFLVVMTFYFTMVLPDKLIYGDRLVSVFQKDSEDTKEVTENGI